MKRNEEEELKTLWALKSSRILQDKFNHILRILKFFNFCKA